MLERHTEYGDGFHKDHASIRHFWEAMRGFSNEDREKLIYFAWGRSRLPTSDAAWRSANVSFKIIQKPDAQCQPGGPDTRMPEAHTCFFQIDMPAYTNAAAAADRLRYAAYEGGGFAFA